MESKKLEYGATVGGTVQIIPTTSTYMYSAQALSELKSLTCKVTEEAISRTATSYKNKLIFQTLPVFMRRRAMSHHPKRLPRKYRSAHLTQMSKAGGAGKSKRTSRKYRRRPPKLNRNLSKNPKGNNRRLETHIWHAKRFKMIKRWGYCLPFASTNKTFHACYRATKQHCLLQDVSYLRLIQIRGDLPLLCEKLRHIVDIEKLSMTANIYVSGGVEGECDIYRIGKHPYGAVQRVRFMWRSQSEEKDSQRTLWLWVHPSTYLLVRDELVTLLNLELLNSKKILHGDKQLEIVKSPSNNINQTYVHKQKKFQLQELTGNFNRFRLTGPLTNAVMAAAFKTSEFGNVNYKWKWFQNAYKTDELDCLQMQAYFWSNISSLRSPGTLLSHMILSLVVEDPRIHRPFKRTKATPSKEIKALDDIFNEKTDKPNNFLLHVGSVLWQSDIMEYLRKYILSTSGYDKLRSKHVAVLGARCLQFERESLQPLPMLLIQNPGNMSSSISMGFGSGWDIIIPSGYGMNVWLSLVMNGALPGGLRETDTICRELCKEEHLPDTMSALIEAREQSDKLREQYFRLPPNKRTNYRKNQVASPFGINFARLVYEWTESDIFNISQPYSNEFCVLRHYGLLHSLRALTLRSTSVPKIFNSRARDWPENIPKSSIIQVEVRMIKRGELKNFSMICMPLPDDIKKFNKNPNINVFMKTIADTNEQKRANLRVEHKLKLKRLRAHRVREKHTLQKFTNKRVHICAAKTVALCAKYWVQMCKLWLPQLPKLDSIGKRIIPQYCLRKQGDREVIGYVTKGSFSFIKGISIGVGYVTVNGLKELMECNLESNYLTPIVLVRNPHNNYYRFATIDISIEI